MPVAMGAAAARQRMKTAGAGSASQDQDVKTRVTDDKVDRVVDDHSSSTNSDVDFETDSDSEDEDGVCQTNAGRIAIEETITPEATLIIFDWDDTLLPTSWIRKQGLRLDDECVPTDEQQAQLESVATSVARMLQRAKRQGEVVLVTNADYGWIELSCQKFMPSLYPFLQHIRTVSARSTFEKLGVACPYKWKQLAFQKEMIRLYGRAPVGHLKNIISFGDSAHEREAVILATEGITNRCTKSVTFAERPEPENLFREHEVIIGCMRHIAKHVGDLDLCISIS